MASFTHLGPQLGRRHLARGVLVLNKFINICYKLSHYLCNFREKKGKEELRTMNFKPFLKCG
jgi:hypothetical protein